MMFFIALVAMFTLGLVIGLVAATFLWVLYGEKRWLEKKILED